MAQLMNLAQAVGTPITLVLVVLARLALMFSPSVHRGQRRQRLRFANVLVVVHLSLLLASWALRPLQPDVAETSRVGAALSGTLANVTLASIVLFEGLIARFRPGLPQIVPDLVTTGSALIALIRTSSREGFELSGIIATSAVLTAVIGLALQDTLGNALGGVALQLDRSIRVGDWIRINEIIGCVVEIHWRYTAVETNDWETVIIPNSALMRSQVTVLGRRRGEPVQWRRQVTFEIDFKHSPNDVFRVIERALARQPLSHVATTPAPQCIALSFQTGFTRYALRYWLVNIAADSAVESQVRNRLFFALSRAGMQMALPLAALSVSTADQTSATDKRASEQKSRFTTLRKVELLSALSDGELDELAPQLEPAPFAGGEVITREGAEAHHLYIVRTGQVSVRVGGDVEAREVARLDAGAVFGEMALLTGDKRKATLIALGDVECYRLSREAFGALLNRRPDLAERFAQVLAERDVKLVAAKQALDESQRESLHISKKQIFAHRIRAFFDLDD